MRSRLLPLALVLLTPACGDSDNGSTDGGSGETHGDHDSHGDSDRAPDSSGETGGDAGGHDSDGHGSDGHGTDGHGSDGGTSEGSTGGDEGSSTGTDTTGGAQPGTWENWAYPEFFTPYCIDCHPSNMSSRDFSDYDAIGANLEHIRCGVAPEIVAPCDGHIEPGHLPIGDGPKPSDDERWRLVQWIDDGMLRD